VVNGLGSVFRLPTHGIWACLCGVILSDRFCLLSDIQKIMHNTQTCAYEIQTNTIIHIFSYRSFCSLLPLTPTLLSLPFSGAISSCTLYSSDASHFCCRACFSVCVAWCFSFVGLVITIPVLSMRCFVVPLKHYYEHRHLSCTAISFSQRVFQN
jgi:hypothetical protein